MPVGVSFDISGAVELVRKTDRILVNFANIGDVFKKIADDFRKTEEGSFAGEGNFEGSAAWAALSPGYSAQKERKFPGRKILEATGRLRKSLTSQNEDSVTTITDTNLTIRSTVPYAKFHYEGTSKMPARPPVSITKAAEDRWAKMTYDYIFKGIV